MSHHARHELHLTDQSVEALVWSASGPTVVWDTALRGFCVELGEHFKQFAIRSLGRRMTLGVWPLVDAVEARVTAGAVLQTLEALDGAVPSSAVTPVASSALALTLQQVLDEYLTVKRLKPRTVGDYRTCLKRYWCQWLNRPFVELTPDNFRAHFVKIPSPAQANYCLRIIRALTRFYNAAHDQSMRCPVAKLLALEGAHPVRARHRLIKDSEQRKWFEATMQQSQTVRDLMVTLACTGLRLGEALGLTWEDVALDNASFEISDTKNRQPHSLPLGTRLHALMRRRQEAQQVDGSSRVFPINARNVRFAVHDIVEASGVVWSPHDLRRGFVTHAVRLEFSDRIIKRLVNHMESDVTGRNYIRLDVEALRKYVQRLEDAIFAHWHDVNLDAG